MPKANTTTESKITREQMIHLLNEDLAWEYQAIITYTVYSQVLMPARKPDLSHHTVREKSPHAADWWVKNVPGATRDDGALIFADSVSEYQPSPSQFKLGESSVF